MCRLLAIIGKSENTALLLEQFQILANNGRVPGTLPGHKDGWGIVGYRKGKIIIYEREPKSAFESGKYNGTVKQVLAAGADIIIGHLRKASVGKNKLVNTHPFIFNNISFAHNGIIFQSDAIPVQLKFVKKIRGTSDSERLFDLILQDTDQLNSNTIRQSITRSIKSVRQQLDYRAMNLLVSDGKRLWALREVNTKNKFVRERKLMQYYTLFIGTEKKSGAMIVASEKIKAPGIRWAALKNQELVEIIKGKEWVKSHTIQF